MFGDITEIYQGATCVAKYKYDAWGNCKVCNPNGTENTDRNFIGNLNSFRYRGYYWDSSVEMYHLQTRWYDPTIGRFISPDSYEYLDPETIGGLNLYSYCLNNPIMYTDPSGHFAIWIFLGVVAISTIAGAIDGGVTAAMSGDNFWKGFAAGAIGGAVSGVINYLFPGVGSNLIGRALSTMIYSTINEVFQTGTLDVNNLGLYIADAVMDVTYSLLYVDKVGNIVNKFINAAVGGVIDAGVDIIQTLLYFSPQAQQRIRGMNNETSSIYKNRITYAY